MTEPVPEEIAGQARKEEEGRNEEKGRNKGE